MTVVQPIPHYADSGLHPWDAMRAWMPPDQLRGFLRGNVIKYVARYDRKGGVADLEKAAHYLAELVAMEKEAAACST